jgi:hypothetical protein
MQRLTKFLIKNLSKYYTLEVTFHIVGKCKTRLRLFPLVFDTCACPTIGTAVLTFGLPLALLLATA